MEELQVAEDVFLDFFGLGLGIEFLQFGDELGDGVFAVAAGDDFEAGAVEAEGTLGHEQDLLVVILAQANAGREAGAGIEIGGGGHWMCPWPGATTS